MNSSLENRGTQEERTDFYKYAISGVFEDSFFDVVFGNPDPQCFRIGWFTKEIPHVDLYVSPSLSEEEIRKLGCDRREVEIHASVMDASEWQVSGLSAIAQSKAFDGFSFDTEIVKLTEGETEADANSGKVLGTVEFRNIYFRIARPHTAGKIRIALLKFALVLEKAGFRNTLPLDFDWIEAVKMDEFDFQAKSASDLVGEMERKEEEEETRSCADTTQARQTLDRIMKNL